VSEAGRLPTEETLDPNDWEAMRALGHRVLDDALTHIRTLRDSPVWRPAPPQVKARFEGPPPSDPTPAEEVYRDYLRLVLPHQIGNDHPRFWGWVAGSGTVMGMYAELLAAATDAVSGAFAYLTNNYVELQVLDWCKTMLGYPADASGLLTSGCSASNLIGLAVARHVKAGFEVRRDGLQGAAERLTVYCSEETHSSIQKAVELLGLGSGAGRAATIARTGGGRSASSGSPGRPTPARSTTSRGWPTCAGTRRCGSTSTARSAPGPRSRHARGTWSPASSGRTRWRSTSTSGCTCRTRSAACWSGTPTTTAGNSR
jgi:hypothetical protein